MEIAGAEGPLERIDGPITEYRASTAEDFWEVLSPQKYLFGPRNKPIFRGQADATWKLEPSVLRDKNHPIYSHPLLRSDPEQSENRIAAEIIALATFATHCDSAGLRIPGDSGKFRRKLDPTGLTVMDPFMLRKKLWPSDEYFEIMALGQHFGLPTRLLDWSHRSYVAAYFAASNALETKDDGKLAVWALNTENKYKLKNVQIIPVPGSNNANVAAQSGLFTLLRQEYRRGQPFEGSHYLDDYVISCDSPDLAKITLPIREAPKVIDLCERHGVTAATLYPDFYGAAKATLVSMACWSRSEWSDGQDIRAQTLPVSSKPATE